MKDGKEGLSVELVWKSVCYSPSENTEWTQMIWAGLNIYLQIKLTALKGEMQENFCSMQEKWRNSNDVFYAT